ncbi:MAG: hypothetical protein QM765_17975 [Myxococcales bacterium]
MGDVVELHVEALGRSGRSDVPAVPQVGACGEALTPTFESVSLVALGGSRLHFADESIATVEYVYDSNTLDGRNYDRFHEQLPCVRALVAAAGGAPAVRDDPLGYPVDTAFLVRPHHLFITYRRPRLTPDLFEEVSVFAGVVLGLEDPSAILQGELSYDFGGRALLTGRVAYWLGSSTSEAGLWPGRFTGVLEVKVSY